MGLMFTNLTLQAKVVQDFLHSNQKFDVVIMEIFLNEAGLGFGPVFNSQSSVFQLLDQICGSMIWWDRQHPSHMCQIHLHPLLIKCRYWNALVTLIGVSIIERLYNDLVYLPQQKQLYDILIPGTKKPCFYELRKNLSMVLLNNHFSISHPKAYVTNMIEVGGMHINRKLRPLSADIKKFLDEAKDGATFFSMGSNLKSKTLPISKREIFLKTFNHLKQRVLWKFEDKELPGKPDNILISDWFPQDDVLSHPNIKLFITHGGLLSSMEAIYHGIPIIGIPMYGDQFLNMAKAEKDGYGITVNYENLNEKILGDAIKEIFPNNKYEMQVKEISRRYRDQPMLPLDTAIYWVEYVARHKGANHIKSASQTLSFIQYHNLDVFTLILLGGFLLYRLVMTFLRKGYVLVKLKRNAK